MTDIHISEIDFPQFEYQVQRMARAVASAFAAQNSSDIGIEINISGRIHGDLRITYAVGAIYDKVKGNSLLAAMNEHFRRQGWHAEHAPTLLTYVEPIEPPETFETDDFTTEDEIEDGTSDHESELLTGEGSAPDPEDEVPF